MKRKAPYEINENNLEGQEEQEPQEEANATATEEDISKRRMVKVSRKSLESSTSSAKLVLKEKLEESKEKTDVNQPEAKEQEEGKKEETAKPLFSSQSSLFGNINSTTSLFGNSKPLSGNSSSLFSGNSTSLFDKLPSFGNSTGLFGNTLKPTEGLFGNSPFIAGNTFKPTEGGLFGTPSTGLFGQQNSLFGNLQSKQTAKNQSDDEEEENGDGDEDEQELSPQIDESKVQKFEYYNPFEKVVDKQVVKVRKGTSEILEKGMVSIEKSKEDEKAPNIFVYRDQIKKVIFTYNIIRKITISQKINNSAKNLKFQFFKKQTNDEVAKEIVKVQFLEEKDGEEFFAQMNTSINPTN